MKLIAVLVCLSALASPALATGAPFDITVNADGGYAATCTFSACGSFMGCKQPFKDYGSFKKGFDLKGGPCTEAAAHFGTDCKIMRSTLCCMKKE